MKRWSRLLVGFLWLLTGWVLAAPPSPADRPQIAEAPPGGDFTLQSSQGPLSLAELRGHVVLLYFGYASCPDICPTSLAIVSQALHALTEQELQRVTGVFVSVDPQRDTPGQLADYVDYFHPSLVGVTGDESEVAAVAERYGVRYYRVELEGSAFGYAVNHSSVTYLVTPDGLLRFIFPHATPASVLVEAVRYVLAGN